MFLIAIQIDSSSWHTCPDSSIVPFRLLAQVAPGCMNISKEIYLTLKGGGNDGKREIENKTSGQYQQSYIDMDITYGAT